MGHNNRLTKIVSPVALEITFFSIILLLFTAVNGFARDVNFSWSANPENVDGYRLYYKTGSSGPPYDGSGAVEGASPVDVGNVTSYTLTNLSDTETYYFVLTAYLGSEESAYSTEIVLQPATQTGDRSISFAWSANPENVDGYRLYYDTDSSGSPYEGVGVTEGDSPVDVGNVTTYTLTGLSETETYYFALKAYQGTVESDYSQEIVLAPGNSPPSASGATIAATEDTVYSGQLSGTDPDGDSLTYVLVSGASKGTVVISDNSTGAFSYTPSPNVNGTDSFTFKVNDGFTDSFEATVNITIAAVNDVPTVSGGSVTTAEDTTTTGQLTGSDIDGDSLTYSIVSNGSKGAATINNSATGTFTYVPISDANGSDSFTFIASDGSADSIPGTVNVTITPVNDTPVASSGSFSVDEDSSRSGQLTGSDADGDSLTFAIASNGSKGSVTITNTSTGAFTYTPNSNETGTDTFSFTVSDGTAVSSAASVSMIISAQNDTPVANSLSVTTSENSAVSGQLSGSDIDGDPLTFAIASNGSLGNATITNATTGAFTYTPNENANGSDSFSYTVNDGTVSSAPATVSVTITAVNDAPVATGGSFSTDEDTAYTGQLSASDSDGDALTFSIANNGNLGSATITDSSTGAFTYTPNENANGSDSFSFTVSDGTLNSQSATISVTVNAVNDPPTISGSSFTTDENIAYSGQLNGSDVDGDPLTFSVVSNGTKGSVEITDPSTGTFIYTPNNGEFGEDSFGFKVNDGTVDSAEATVSVTINVVNEPPVAAEFSVTTDVNTEFADRLLGHDVDGDALTYTIVSNGSKGNVVITDGSAGTFTYTPTIDATGSDTFTYSVNDGLVDSNVATVKVEILDATTRTSVFGEGYGADYPSTMGDTFITATADKNQTAEILQTYSFADSPPHKIAGTSILKVDLSDIPTYATVIEAKLVLYQSAASGATQYNNSVHRITGVDPLLSEVTGTEASAGQAWTAVPAGTTYNDVPLGLADVADAEDTQLLFDQPEYRSWTITNMAQEWIAQPSTNYGLLIVGEEAGEETTRAFASSENGNAAIRPQIVVRYKLIPRPPQLIMIEEIK